MRFLIFFIFFLSSWHPLFAQKKHPTKNGRHRHAMGWKKKTSLPPVANSSDEKTLTPQVPIEDPVAVVDGPSKPAKTIEYKAWKEGSREKERGAYSDHFIVPSGDIGDVLKDSIPYIDTFLGPLADQLEEDGTGIFPSGEGVVFKVALRNPISYPMPVQGGNWGGVQSVDVDVKASFFVRNQLLKASVEDISGISFSISIPEVQPGVIRVYLRKAIFDIRKQKLFFLVGTEDDTLLQTGSVDLITNQFLGLDMSESISLSATSAFGLMF